MSKIKKCITMLLALAVVLSVVQIPAFAAETEYFALNGGKENLGNKYWYPLWDINDSLADYIYNIEYPNFKTWSDSGNHPGQGSNGFWAGNGTTMLGGNQVKVWLKFDNSQTIPKNQSFIVECEIRGFNSAGDSKGPEYIMGMITDNIVVEDYDHTVTKTFATPKDMEVRYTGALFGRRASDNCLMAATQSVPYFTDHLLDSNGGWAYAPADSTTGKSEEWARGTDGWHKYKIYCDASKYTDNLYMDVTVTDVTDSTHPIVYQTVEKVGSSASGSWTGIFFMNNSTDAMNTKLVEFNNLRVYAPETFAVPTFSSSVELKDSSDATVGDTVAVGTTVTANMTVTNTVGVQGNAYLILAEYDSTGTLVNVKVNDSFDLATATTEKKIATDPITLSNAGGTVKAFLWTDKLRALNKADTATIAAAE